MTYLNSWGLGTRSEDEMEVLEDSCYLFFPPLSVPGYKADSREGKAMSSDEFRDLSFVKIKYFIGSEEYFSENVFRNRKELACRNRGWGQIRGLLFL